MKVTKNYLKRLIMEELGAEHQELVFSSADYYMEKDRNGSPILEVYLSGKLGDQILDDSRGNAPVFKIPSGDLIHGYAAEQWPNVLALKCINLLGEHPSKYVDKIEALADIDKNILQMKLAERFQADIQKIKLMFGLKENKMKLTIKEKMEVTQEGFKEAGTGIAAAALLFFAGVNIKNYSAGMDMKTDYMGQLAEKQIPFPTMARGFLKVTGQEFGPKKGQDYKTSLISATASLIGKGFLKIDEKGDLQVVKEMTPEEKKAYAF